MYSEHFVARHCLEPGGKFPIYHQLDEIFVFLKNVVQFVKQNYSVDSDQNWKPHCYWLCFSVFSVDRSSVSFSTREEKNWLKDKNLVVRFRSDCKDT